MIIYILLSNKLLFNLVWGHLYWYVYKHIYELIFVKYILVRLQKGATRWKRSTGACTFPLCQMAKKMCASLKSVHKPGTLHHSQRATCTTGDQVWAHSLSAPLTDVTSRVRSIRWPREFAPQYDTQKVQIETIPHHSESFKREMVFYIGLNVWEAYRGFLHHHIEDIKSMGVFAHQ